MSYDNDIPYFVDYETVNKYNAAFDPSTMHASDTGLSAYFQRYLIQKVISCYEFEVPRNWDKAFFLYTLFCSGHVAVFEDPQYGVIHMNCGLAGRNLYYQPKYATIANTLLTQFKQLEIGKNCEIIRMQPDYGGCFDLVNYYGGMLALCASTASVNLLNSKLSYVFFAKNKAAAEAFKKMSDQILSGQPVVVIDKALFDDDGTPLWQTFSQDLQKNYIAGDILDDMTKWDARFCTDIGIPNVNISKASGVSNSEVRANDVDTGSKIWVWYDTIRRGIDTVKEHFGDKLDGELSVKLRYNYEGGDQDGMAVDNGDV